MMLSCSYSDLIDRASPIPTYLQIAYSLIRKISEEEWVVGEQLPAENTLAEWFGTSRVTIRQALARLEADGLIRRQRGKGGFVSAKPAYIVQDLQFPAPGEQRHPLVAPENKVTSRNIRLAELETGNRRAARMLRLPENTPLVYLERLFENEGTVVGINRAWFPKFLVPGLVERGLLRDSISATLREIYALSAAEVENFIEAEILDAYSAKILGSAYASPALCIQSVYYLSDGTPIEYASTTWNGNHTQFHLRVMA